MDQLIKAYQEELELLQSQLKTRTNTGTESIKLLTAYQTGINYLTAFINSINYLKQQVQEENNALVLKLQEQADYITRLYNELMELKQKTGVLKEPRIEVVTNYQTKKCEHCNKYNCYKTSIYCFECYKKSKNPAYISMR